MRYFVNICLLFVQLLGYFTAEAGKPFQINDLSQHENAVISASSFHYDHSAEVARPIHLNYTTFKLIGQRFPAGILSINNPGYYIPDELRKRENVCPTSIWIPLVRLLLFPKHYFW